MELRTWVNGPQNRILHVFLSPSYKAIYNVLLTEWTAKPRLAELILSYFRNDAIGQDCQREQQYEHSAEQLTYAQMHIVLPTSCSAQGAGAPLYLFIANLFLRLHYHSLSHKCSRLEVVNMNTSIWFYTWHRDRSPGWKSSVCFFPTQPLQPPPDFSLHCFPCTFSECLSWCEMKCKNQRMNSDNTYN